MLLSRRQPARRAAPLPPPARLRRAAARLTRAWLLVPRLVAFLAG